MELEKCKTFDIKVEQVFVKLDVVFFRLKKFFFEAFILRIEQSMKALLSFDVKNFFLLFTFMIPIQWFQRLVNYHNIYS